jgi:hypothetical protein
MKFRRCGQSNATGRCEYPDEGSLLIVSGLWIDDRCNCPESHYPQPIIKKTHSYRELDLIYKNGVQTGKLDYFQSRVKQGAGRSND